MHSHYILELYRYPSTPIWILPLRGKLSHHNPSVIFQHLHFEEVVICLNCPADHFTDFRCCHTPFHCDCITSLSTTFPPANRYTNLAGAALQYMTTGTLLCVQDLVVTRSKLMGFHMYQTCGDQPPQGCGGIQFVLANFTVVALLFFVHW
ncbi:hypothetical protein B0H14DRAFT_2682811 [Mycena olivaceomarginata]|nr:hypothetical protein B0H14DRAFT_2682811 [Mycena olivaceomarginata]